MGSQRVGHGWSTFTFTLLTPNSPFLSSKEACLLLSYLFFLLGKWRFGLVPPLLFNFFLRLLLIHWILSYCSMSFFIHILQYVWSYVVLYEWRELFPVSILIFFNQVTHVICSILPHDVLWVYLSTEFFVFWIITREPFGTVRDRETFIDGSLQGPRNYSQ